MVAGRDRDGARDPDRDRWPPGARPAPWPTCRSWRRCPDGPSNPKKATDRPVSASPCSRSASCCWCSPAASTAAETPPTSTRSAACWPRSPGWCSWPRVIIGQVARVARHVPVAARIALRDLARYRARSGAALAAASLAVLIAMLIALLADQPATPTPLDYVGPNLPPNQLIVYTPGNDAGDAAAADTLPSSQQRRRAGHGGLDRRGARHPQRARRSAAAVAPTDTGLEQVGRAAGRAPSTSTSPRRRCCGTTGSPPARSGPDRCSSRRGRACGLVRPGPAVRQLHWSRTRWSSSSRLRRSRPLPACPPTCPTPTCWSRPRSGRAPAAGGDGGLADPGTPVAHAGADQQRPAGRRGGGPDDRDQERDAIPRRGPQRRDRSGHPGRPRRARDDDRPDPQRDLRRHPDADCHGGQRPDPPGHHRGHGRRARPAGRAGRHRRRLPGRRRLILECRCSPARPLFPGLDLLRCWSACPSWRRPAAGCSPGASRGRSPTSPWNDGQDDPSTRSARRRAFPARSAAVTGECREDGTGPPPAIPAMPARRPPTRASNLRRPVSIFPVAFMILTDNVRQQSARDDAEF